MIMEQITIDIDVFYCDHDPDCLEKIKLPTLAAETLRADTALILLIGNHKSPRPVADKAIAKGKGWKVCRVLP